jgi:hypothetical protein
LLKHFGTAQAGRPVMGYVSVGSAAASEGDG